MSFSCGFIGLPNSGKSTIFNALTALAVPCQPYPFCTIDPNIGIVAVPDRRLFSLAALLNPEKVTQTTIGLSILQSQQKMPTREKVSVQVSSHIRNVDATAHVIRAFTSVSAPCLTLYRSARDMESLRRRS